MDCPKMAKEKKEFFARTAQECPGQPDGPTGERSTSLFATYYILKIGAHDPNPTTT